MEDTVGYFVALLILVSLTGSRARGGCGTVAQQQCCSKVLRPGQYYCTSPRIDLNSQSAADCSPDGLVNVPCFAAPNVTCVCSDMHMVVDYNESQCVFLRPLACRYVTGRRYDYRVAVALSLFFGMLGIDRFYLGYPAIGLLKLCTLGFFFIGHLIDFLLILVQVVGPADRSGYYAPLYGPLLNRTGLFVPIPDGDSNATCITNYSLDLEDMEL